MRTALVLALVALPTALLADEYPPIGRRDPFQPPIRATTSTVAKIALERFEITELSVDGIVCPSESASEASAGVPRGAASGISDPRATVIVPGGESFLVGVGTRVGKHGGRVARISQTDVVVREEFTDPMGVVHVVESTLSIAEPLPL